MWTLPLLIGLMIFSALCVLIALFFYEVYADSFNQALNRPELNLKNQKKKIRLNVSRMR